MEKSFPFNAVIVDGVPDRVYTAEDFAAERAAYVSNGVTAADALTVSPGADGGMSVDIAAGAAVIDGYTYFNTAPLTLVPEEADVSLPRVDLVVLRLDLRERRMYCAVKTGTAAEVPTAPVCETGEEIREIALAQINVAAGESVIESAHIMDLRVRADYILNRLEVEELLEKYRTAMENYFNTEDADRLVEASKIVRGDAGAGTVLCGDGLYREYAGKLTELVRFTGDGTFCPADYPSVGGVYTVLIQGAGGSGGWGHDSHPVYGGCAGATYVASNLMLDESKTYNVTIGKGGAGVTDITIHGGCAGKDGGETSFDGFTVPGGRGGQRKDQVDNGTHTMLGAQAGVYTAAVGTLLRGGKGADSVLGKGGQNVIDEDDLSLMIPSGSGAGGGACGIPYKYSGAGGDGAVVIYGYVK